MRHAMRLHASSAKIKTSHRIAFISRIAAAGLVCYRTRDAGLGPALTLWSRRRNYEQRRRYLSDGKDRPHNGENPPTLPRSAA